MVHVPNKECLQSTMALDAMDAPQDLATVPEKSKDDAATAVAERLGRGGKAEEQKKESS